MKTIVTISLQRTHFCPISRFTKLISHILYWRSMSPVFQDHSSWTACLRTSKGTYSSIPVFIGKTKLTTTFPVIRTVLVLQYYWLNFHVMSGVWIIWVWPVWMWRHGTPKLQWKPVARYLLRCVSSPAASKWPQKMSGYGVTYATSNTTCPVSGLRQSRKRIFPLPVDIIKYCGVSKCESRADSESQVETLWITYPVNVRFRN